MDHEPSPSGRRTWSDVIVHVGGIHAPPERDVVEAVERALASGVHGVINIVAQTQAPLSRLLAARGSKSVFVPGMC